MLIFRHIIIYKNRPSDPTIDTIETFDIPFEFRTTLGENILSFKETNILEGYIVLGDVQIVEHIFNSYAKRNLFNACNINENERRRDNTRQKKKV